MEIYAYNTKRSVFNNWIKKGVFYLVYVFLAQGFEEIEAISVIDILRRADVTVQTVSISNSKEVEAAHGITILADITLDEVDIELADMIFLPGGMPGSRNLAKSDRLLEIIKQAYDSEKYVTAICAAPTVLAKAGILKGKKAICYPGFEAELTDAVIHDDLVVRDGKILTSKGPGTAMLFAYALVDILKGNLESDALQEAMIFKWCIS